MLWNLLAFLSYSGAQALNYSTCPALPVPAKAFCCYASLQPSLPAVHPPRPLFAALPISSPFICIFNSGLSHNRWTCLVQQLINMHWALPPSLPTLHRLHTLQSATSHRASPFAFHGVVLFSYLLRTPFSSSTHAAVLFAASPASPALASPTEQITKKRVLSLPQRRLLCGPWPSPCPTGRPRIP